MRDGISLSQRLAAASRAADRALGRRLARHGADPPTWRILHYLAGRRGAIPADLAEVLGLARTTVTHHLRKLHDAGLVEERDPIQDLRCVFLSITDPGREFHARLLPEVEAHEREVRAVFREPEVARMDRALDLLAQRLRGEESSAQYEQRIERELSGGRGTIPPTRRTRR